MMSEALNAETTAIVEADNVVEPIGVVESLLRRALNNTYDSRSKKSLIRQALVIVEKLHV